MLIITDTASCDVFINSVVSSVRRLLWAAAVRQTSLLTTVKVTTKKKTQITSKRRKYLPFRRGTIPTNLQHRSYSIPVFTYAFWWCVEEEEKSEKVRSSETSDTFSTTIYDVRILYLDRCENLKSCKNKSYVRNISLYFGTKAYGWR